VRIAELSETRIVFVTHNYLPIIVIGAGFVGMGSLFLVVVLSMMNTANTGSPGLAGILCPLFFVAIGFLVLYYLPHSYIRILDKRDGLLTCKDQSFLATWTRKVPLKDIVAVLTREAAGMDAGDDPTFGVLVKRTSGKEVHIGDARKEDWQRELALLLRAFLQVPGDSPDDKPPSHTELAGLIARIRRVERV
jgi:hypothetical protein